MPFRNFIAKVSAGVAPPAVSVWGSTSSQEPAVSIRNVVIAQIDNVVITPVDIMWVIAGAWTIYAIIKEIRARCS